LLNGIGKSLSEALLYAEHGENMFCTKIVLNVRNNFCTQHVLPSFELLSYCGLVDSKIRASDKDLPVNHGDGTVNPFIHLCIYQIHLHSGSAENSKSNQIFIS
jgi:hypothetical protein